jgi:hypothetical protein
MIVTCSRADMHAAHFSAAVVVEAVGGLTWMLLIGGTHGVGEDLERWAKTGAHILVATPVRSRGRWKGLGLFHTAHWERFTSSLKCVVVVEVAGIVPRGALVLLIALEVAGGLWKWDAVFQSEGWMF